MKSIPLLTTLILVGCATPFRAPPDVAHLKLTPIDSATTDIDRIWLERRDGELVVRGYAHRRLGAVAGTAHVDVAWRDASGRVLRQTTAALELPSAQVPSRPAAPASYRVALDPLPAGTAQIEVRAHDGGAQSCAHAESS